MHRVHGEEVRRTFLVDGPERPVHHRFDCRTGAASMTTIRHRTICVLILSALACGTAAAAPPVGKKLYCWTDKTGHKTCGDALPPEAAADARTEISAKNGRQTGEVSRAMTVEERAAAAAAADQAQAAAEAEAARQRRDLAMVESYNTEADLRRAFGERIGLMDANIKASLLGVSNLRLSLASLLAQASNLELAGKPVPATLVSNVRNQHVELGKEQRILAQQQQDRRELDGELADAVARYQALKQKQAGDAAPAPATPPAG
jgi:hypothetical protein